MHARLEYTLEDGTLVHWHHIRLPNATARVKVLTQDVVTPGGTYD
jgi:FtsP/CotA-like multicopper oxidase with cupredoxin domain